MKTVDGNSGSYVAYRDFTNSSNASMFCENSAPSGNLASIMRNWFIVQNPAPEAAAEEPLPDIPPGGSRSAFK